MGADPLSWGAMGLMAANTVAGHVNAGRAARDARRNAERQADAARSEGARRSAAILRKARLDKQKAGADYRRARASARVGVVDSGVSLGSGSAMEILTNAAANHALEQSRRDEDAADRARQAREGGRTAAYGYEQKARSAGTDEAARALRLGESILSLGSKYGKGL